MSKTYGTRVFCCPTFKKAVLETELITDGGFTISSDNKLFGIDNAPWYEYYYLEKIRLVDDGDWDGDKFYDEMPIAVEELHYCPFCGKALSRGV